MPINMDHKVVVVILYIITAIILCSEAPSVKMTNAVCESYNKSWVVIDYCRLKAYSRTKTSLNINATFLEPANNIFVKAKLMKRARGYKPFLVDFTTDACLFMRRRTHPFAKKVWNLIKDVSTVNHTCPYVGLQVVRDFHNIQLPLSLPTGDYLLLIDWLFEGKPQFTTNIYFNFVEDLLIRS